MSFRAAARDGMPLHAVGLRLFLPLGRPQALLLIALSVTGPLAAWAAGNQADDVLNKLNATYNSARSYEGDVVIYQTGKDPKGKALSVTTTEHIRFKSPNKFSIQLSMKGTGAAADTAAKMGRSYFSDGHITYVYSPAQKQYMKQITRPVTNLAQLMQLPKTNMPGAKTSLAAPTTVQGRSAFDVRIGPDFKGAPNMTPQQKASMMATMKPIDFLVDRQNYHLLKMIRTTGPSTMTVEYGRQTFNGNIPDSAFTFHPPAGAKEAVAPTPPMGQGGGRLMPPGGNGPRKP